MAGFDMFCEIISAADFTIAVNASKCSFFLATFVPDVPTQVVFSVVRPSTHFTLEETYVWKKHSLFAVLSEQK